MWIARGISIGLAVAGLAIVGIMLTPQQGWADGGKGLIFPTPDIIYSDDEDEDEDEDKIETLEATPEPERSSYSVPKSVGFSVATRYSFSNRFSLSVDYTDAADNGVKTEESTAESTVYTTKYSYSANLLVRPEYRYSWRFPESDYVDADDGEEEPATTPLIPKMKYRFSTWVRIETLDAFNEEKETGATNGSDPIKLSESGREWAEAIETRAKVARWLGNDAFKKFESQYGSAGDDIGAEDQSGWNGARIYCGATCVGQYY